jgi:hypothetical protein
MADVQDFLDQLSDLGTRVDSVDLLLSEIGSQIVNDITARAPVDTGALKSSIRSVVENNILRIQMLYYGPFQNYGVVGTLEDRAVDVPFGINPPPREGSKYKFRLVDAPVGGRLPYAARMTIRRRGLASQGFFDLNQIKNSIIQKLENSFTNL